MNNDSRPANNFRDKLISASKIYGAISLIAVLGTFVFALIEYPNMFTWEPKEIFELIGYIFVGLAATFMCCGIIHLIGNIEQYVFSWFRIPSGLLLGLISLLLVILVLDNLSKVASAPVRFHSTNSGSDGKPYFLVNDREQRIEARGVFISLDPVHSSHYYSLTKISCSLEKDTCEEYAIDSNREDVTWNSSGEIWVSDDTTYWDKLFQGKDNFVLVKYLRCSINIMHVNMSTEKVRILRAQYPDEMPTKCSSDFFHKPVPVLWEMELIDSTTTQLYFDYPKDHFFGSGMKEYVKNKLEKHGVVPVFTGAKPQLTNEADLVSVSEKWLRLEQWPSSERDDYLKEKDRIVLNAKQYLARGY